MHKQKGFTLIELLIVLAILGILVGIVAMSVGTLTDTAKERGMKSEKEIIQTAIDTYNTQDVVVDGEDPIPVTTTTAAANDLWVVLTAGGSDYDFTTYLKRNTKYYYQWDAEGEGLIVANDATGGTPSY